MHYQGVIIRPPSEAFSILLQVTLGCSHNRCTFCGTYKGKRFTIKDDHTILNDILYAARYMRQQHRLFLLDGDALIVPQKKLLWILQEIRRHLPWVRRVGAYANAKSIMMKSDADLQQLRDNGLGILYVGVESGDDETLKQIHKGTTAANLINQAKRVKQAGIKLSVTVLLGIAGRQRSLVHARATGEVLTAMDPDYVGALTVMLLPNTPLVEDYAAGEFDLPDRQGLLMELREMFVHTQMSKGLFFANHASNYLPIKARLPRDRQSTMELLDAALRGEVALKPEWLRRL
ncbi:MAG: B12-binding domain-containing radical SAM protein [Deltaproteobacteria bacterium]|nr:B12-binding domain-containing radical SAM protein [Deltaproteobacteria bacterium]MBW2069635.1 B12-binding domain-containing radical SAM protein [Deltaproteobacteria bacterium]